MGGGEGDCGLSRIALVESLLRAIFLSDGGGGRYLSSSGGVSDELASCTGCGLNVARLISVTPFSDFSTTYMLSLPSISLIHAADCTDSLLPCVSSYPVPSQQD